MKKFLLICLLLVGFTYAFADSATVTYIHGKADVLRTDGNWYELSVGDTIEESETVSTGFYSDMKLEYNSSIISLGALTRVKLETLSTSTDKDNVSLYLNVGAVRSKVTHTKERRVSYVVKSPVAVASVRGTDFTFTASGAITCNEGAVVVYPNTERFDISTKGTELEDAEDESEEDSESDEEADSTPEASVAAENPETVNSETAEADDVSTETPESDAGDYGPATSTTPAKEIADNAPAGAIVVGKNQTVTVTTTGNTETPIANATKKSKQAKTVVTTAATQEAEVAGSTTTTETTVVKETATTTDIISSTPGSITAEIILQD